MSKAKYFDELINDALIKNALVADKFWRFRQFHSKVFWLFRFGFYQDPSRMKFGIGADWSEQPFLIEINIIFWTIEINVYKNKKEIY